MAVEQIQLLQEVGAGSSQDVLPTAERVLWGLRVHVVRVQDRWSEEEDVPPVLLLGMRHMPGVLCAVVAPLWGTERMGLWASH